MTESPAEAGDPAKGRRLGVLGLHALDGFSGHLLLDAHVELRGEANARAVNLTEDVGVLAVLTIRQHEVCSPDQRNVVAAELLSDDWADLSLT